MAAFTYTAQRSLVLGHTAGDDYTIELRLRPFNVEREILRIDQRTMSGATERIYLGARREWSLTTVSIPPDFAPYVREFLYSTEDGQSFTADLHGSLSSPNEPVTVFRIDTRTSEERSLQLGDGGRGDYFRFSFSLREE